MKTVTQAFLNEWNSKGIKFSVKQIQYKRRYWNGAAYVYEASFHILYLSDFIASVGTLTWNLDSVFLNEFRASNITLRLKNGTYQWLPENLTTGLFGPDALATSGYDPYLSIFKVKIGYELADETEELVTLFTGYLIDWFMDSTSGLASMVISGSEQLLLAADAQLVAGFFTAQPTVPALGDGVNKDFLTTSQGVGFVTRVLKNAVAQKEGLDYTLSQLNTYGVPAKISFVSPPAAGATILAYGSVWKTNTKLEDLVGFLCDQAGVTDRTINPVVLPNVGSSKTIDTMVQWQAGSVLQNINATLDPDFIRQNWYLLDNFASLDYSKWTIKALNGTASAATGASVFTGTGPGIKRVTASLAIINAVGTLSFTIKAGDESRVYFLMDSDTVDSDGVPSGHGYCLRYSHAAQQVDFLRVSNSGSFTIASVADIWLLTDVNTWQVSRDSTGVFTIYKNGVVKFTETDNTYSASVFALISQGSVGGSNVMTFDDFYYSTFILNTSAITPLAAVYESAEFDLLAAPSAWGILEKLEILNGGTTIYSTNVATFSGGPYDGYVAVAADGQINSALKRFLKIRIEIAPGAGLRVGPVVDRVIANFSTSSVFLTLANFTGLNCFAAIEKIANLCNFEWGFDGNGKFFFRSKAVSTTQFRFDQANKLVKIKQLRPGFQEVINSGQVSYPPYYREYNSQSLPEPAPTSEQKFGKKILALTIDLLLANDADIASGMARLIHDANYLPRKRLLVEIAMTPHLDLSDVAEITFSESDVRFLNVWGDPLNDWNPAFGEDKAFLAKALKCKVVGISYNFDAETMDLTLEEVLS